MVFKYVVVLSILHLVLCLPYPEVNFSHLSISAGGNVNVAGENVNVDSDDGNSNDGPPPPQPECPESLGYGKLQVSGRCLKLFLDIDRDWYESMTKCREHGMIMVKTTPADANSIRDALVDQFGAAGSYAWLDAKFDGAQFVWNDGEVIADSSPLWYEGEHGKMPILTEDYCLVLLNGDVFRSEKPSEPYWSGPCRQIERKAFCEYVQHK